MVQLHWSQWNGVLCWIDVFENTLISISRPTPENVYLDKNILILGGLEAEICWHVLRFGRPFFKMAGVSRMFVFLLDWYVYKYFIHYQYPWKCIFTKYYLDKNISILGGLEAEKLTGIQIWSTIW